MPGNCGYPVFRIFFRKSPLDLGHPWKVTLCAFALNIQSEGPLHQTPEGPLHQTISGNAK